MRFSIGQGNFGTTDYGPLITHHVSRTAHTYFTTSGRLSLWLLNSGAYRHWISATPV